MMLLLQERMNCQAVLLVTSLILSACATPDVSRKTHRVPIRDCISSNVTQRIAISQRIFVFRRVCVCSARLAYNA
jgi:hypothetical protein